MKRKEYPIHPDFKPISAMNPPLYRALLPVMQKSMAALWFMEKSGDGVNVRPLEIPLDQKKSMKALLYSPEGCSGSLSDGQGLWCRAAMRADADLSMCRCAHGDRIGKAV